MYGSGLNDDPVHDRSLGPSSGEGSHFGSSRATGETPATSTDPTSTGSATTGTGYDSVVNTKPFSSHGLGTTELNEPSSTHDKSRTLDDTATTASIKSGVAGKPQSSSLTSSTGNKDIVDTNKPLPHEPTGAGLGGTLDNSAAGPHSSSLANRADPRVDSDLDGSRGLGGSATGTGSGLSHEPTGAGLRGTPDKSAAGPHSSSLANRADPRVDSHLDGSKGLGKSTTGVGSGLTGGSLPDRSVER